MSYQHAYHHWSGSTRGQWIFPVSEWYPQICLLFMAMAGWQNWLWSLAMQARPSMRISFHGWRSIMLRRSRWMPERTTILRPSENIVRQSHGSGCIWNPYQFRILSRVAPSLVNPGNMHNDICINSSYHHRLGVFDIYKHLGVSLFVWACLKSVCILTISRANDAVQ